MTRFGPGATAAEIRALAAPPPERDVRAILADVRKNGDEAVRRLTAAIDGIELGELRVEPSTEGVEPGLLDALRIAISNVEAVARAQLNDPTLVELPQGQRVEIAELPVRRAAAYVPGGRAPYPSTVVMCAVSARVAGVEQLAVCSPRPHPLVLAACALCGVEELYAIGGAQAVAALAYGTESVPRVDLIVGPGNSWVQEAKRQLAGVVGIDSVAGPSELVVVASEGADPQLIVLDLLAQAEHGPDSLVALISPDVALLDAVAESVPVAVLVEAAGVGSALQLAEEIAPEHLELMGEEAEALAGSVRRAGCLFVGSDAGTAFGDYVAGSNHVLPTGGAARFAGALGPSTFRRRMARVSLPPGAAAQLAPAGAALARAEGFPLHAESMERRA